METLALSRKNYHNTQAEGFHAGSVFPPCRKHCNHTAAVTSTVLPRAGRGRPRSDLAADAARLPPSHARSTGHGTKGASPRSDAHGTEQGAWVQFGRVFYGSLYLAESQRKNSIVLLPLWKSKCSKIQQQQKKQNAFKERFGLS